jgi:cytochrome bd-type quinol oxidase subunit 2
VSFGVCVALTTVFTLGLATGVVSIGSFSAEYQSAVFDPVAALLGLVVPLMWAVPGVVVLLRADWHPVGWMLILCGIGFGLSFDLGSVALWDEFVPISRPWAAWISDGWGPYVTFLGLVALLSVFPDGLGERGSRFRRWKIIRLGSVSGLLMVAALQTHSGGVEGNLFPQPYPNPTGLGVLSPELGNLIFAPVLVVLVSAVWALRRESRRVTEDRRRQYTWVLFPLGLLAFFTTAAISLMALLGDGVWIGVVVIYLAFPVAFVMAIVRHRWFDIDRLVSRTVTYGVVAAAVAVIYAIPVLVLPEILGLSGDLTVAGATLLAAAAFSPLRARIQRAVARRFDRVHYDAERVMDEFAGRVQTATDVWRLREQVRDVVGRALGPATVDLWVETPHSRSVESS